MKRASLIAIFSLAYCCAALAQQQPAMYQGHMDKLDSNSNGSVSRSEYQTFMSTAFTQLDKSKDGYLQPDEVTQILTTQQFQATDSNNDSRVSQNEFMARVMADFASADRSQDGSLQ
ncbi:EF-hand domain-containing protein [Rhizobiaceae bacterium n13]|uniref:EF-hand domain-containing protein n=1 Tax=Ferirhizobium litorale TaxID=2927786 RepID=A0AAE3QFM7_9HYPH|nr:EF-hand domain-containing protein [Fererhizobium litorale]MDI7863217.1 EF-hand domain-containing protein [Fererhizobium litorale]MDI7923048.1 EF-hand domain-containing protein [Fererhizobium litorale]